MAELISDEEFARRLREFTGDNSIWVDDWQENDRNVSPPDTDPDQTGGASVTDLNDGPDEADFSYLNDELPSRETIMSEEEFVRHLREEDWQSDDSTEMILNVRHLAIKNRKKKSGKEEKSTEPQKFLNKARSAVADPPGFPVLQKSLAELEQVAWVGVGLERGDLSVKGESFTPWKIVRKYPYSYIGNRNRDACEPFFKAEEICENRTWDFYYLYHPLESTRKAYLLVPTEQFQHLLDTVNTKLGLSLAIPDGSSNEKFVMQFGDGNTPRPRFLGRSNSYETFGFLSDNVPPLNTADKSDTLQNCAFLAREDFLSQLDMIHQAGKSGKGKEKNRLKRIENRKTWGHSVKRVQRYLGLRHKIYYPNDGAPIAPPKSLDLNSPMVNKMEHSALFIAIDIEAYEFNQNCITEVGIVILDTKDIENIPPGQGGQSWFSKIQARHIRVKENTWAVNRRHIQGCANRFDFGDSEFVPIAEVLKILDEVIEARAADGQKRAVALVFHDASQDIAYLEKLGCDIGVYQNIFEIVDTRNMHQYIVRRTNPSKLENVLDFLDIPCQNLHNAGNDAVYTLQAMISLAVKKRMASLEKFFGEKDEEQKAKTADTPTPYSELTEKGEGWSSHGEETDGGLAEKLRDPW